MKKSHSKFMEDAKSILQQAKSEPVTAERAIELAAFMIEEAKRIQTWRERSLQAQLARMMNDPIGKVFLTSMTDQCFRCKSSGRVADQLVYLIKKFGIPRFFSNIKRLGLAGFFWLGRPLAGLLVPLVKWMVQRETSSVILPGEAKQLSKHLTARRQEGVNVNLNHLGEAILGEEEAKHRLSIYLKDLANPEIECISIKISTIYSQINLLSRQETLAVLSERLRRLYRCARDHQFVRSDGTSTPKFVNLDMEEYRDLYLTVE
jgi:RHH-type proline utilization regulon transcriptional repressor/proline dehydrogenase/delta 1-pyrroline-5-carboxylate dehydrogenase